MTEVDIHRASDEERAHIREVIQAVLKQDPDILFAFLHGSFVHGDLFRDVDVAVVVRPRALASAPPSPYEDRLTDAIEDALATQLHFRAPVDLKVLNDAPLPFCFEAARGLLIHCSDEEALTDFLESVARRYLDMAPLRHHYLMEAMT